jgi:GrpB-like predicted nucleotidyltransferase (UPF0157 family)
LIGAFRDRRIYSGVLVWKMDSRSQRVAHFVQEEIKIVRYDPAWPERFRQEKAHRLACLPRDLVRRIEH